MISEVFNMDCMEIPLVKKGVKGFQKGHSYKSWIGRKHSPETKLKMRLARLKNNPMHNADIVKKRSKTLIANGTFAKERSNNWRGGVSDKNKLERETPQYKNWRAKVFERDNYTCQECGVRSAKGRKVYLEAHHVKPYATHISLRLELRLYVSHAMIKNQKEKRYGVKHSL